MIPAITGAAARGLHRRSHQIAILFVIERMSFARRAAGRQYDADGTANRPAMRPVSDQSRRPCGTVWSLAVSRLSDAFSWSTLAVSVPWVRSRSPAVVSIDWTKTTQCRHCDPARQRYPSAEAFAKRDGLSPTGRANARSMINPAIPISCSSEGDGFREALNQSYALRA